MVFAVAATGPHLQALAGLLPQPRHPALQWEVREVPHPKRLQHNALHTCAATTEARITYGVTLHKAVGSCSSLQPQSGARGAPAAVSPRVHQCAQPGFCEALDPAGSETHRSGNPTLRLRMLLSTKGQAFSSLQARIQLLQSRFIETHHVDHRERHCNSCSYSAAKQQCSAIRMGVSPASVCTHLAQTGRHTQCVGHCQVPLAHAALLSPT